MDSTDILKQSGALYPAEITVSGQPLEQFKKTAFEEDDRIFIKVSDTYTIVYEVQSATELKDGIQKVTLQRIG